MSLIVNGLSANFYVLLVFQIIVTALYWALFFIKNRLKGKFMAVLVGLTILYYVLFIVAIEFLVQCYDEKITFESKVSFTFI